MKVSVAMCTYNGAKYIREQLDSILLQTRSVDEIIISDDGSSDDTVDILRMYAEKYPCVHFAKNTTNKGFKLNFLDTMRQCTGDIVFLADQDDRWLPNKVEYILDWYSNHPQIQLVFTNANIIDGEGNPTGETAFELVGFDSEKQKAALNGFLVSILCVGNRATGATMAIRKDFIKSYKDEWYTDEKFHDIALVTEAAGKEVAGFIPEPLMAYRLHDNNVGGLDRAEYLYWSPYIPLQVAYAGESRWTKRTRQLLAFSRQRSTFKYSWFGMKVYAFLFQYMHFYGSLWHKAVLYDIKEAWSHSITRMHNLIFKKLWSFEK